MYKAELRLTPWPKGSALRSHAGAGWRTVNLESSHSDTEAIKEASMRAGNLKSSLNLATCEVVRVFEVTEREIPVV